MSSGNSSNTKGHYEKLYKESKQYFLTKLQAVKLDNERLTNQKLQLLSSQYQEQLDSLNCRIKELQQIISQQQSQLEDKQKENEILQAQIQSLSQCHQQKQQQQQLRSDRGDGVMQQENEKNQKATAAAVRPPPVGQSAIKLLQKSHKPLLFNPRPSENLPSTGDKVKLRQGKIIMPEDTTENDNMNVRWK
ncbi:hypothetical protein MIR68_000419 [Amoeboaphelidium protococcarum]|nr:hypothetical protein MIR68_000419 [Amoeboaphelidium protococcarum]